MFSSLPHISVPAKAPLLQQSVDTMNWLWPALPFITFLLGLVLGAALMYISMTLRIWKLRERLAKSDGNV